ncbi:MAG: hypothetical protein V1837_03530 [Candidatus Woesearchaeota archaeon]
MEKAKGHRIVPVIDCELKWREQELADDSLETMVTRILAVRDRLDREDMFKARGYNNWLYCDWDNLGRAELTKAFGADWRGEYILDDGTNRQLSSVFGCVDENLFCHVHKLTGMLTQLSNDRYLLLSKAKPLDEMGERISADFKEVYKLASIIKSITEDKDFLVETYHKRIEEEMGTPFFRGKLLRYIADEYGYDEIADRLKVLSISEIGQKLRNIKRKELPLHNLEIELASQLKTASKTKTRRIVRQLNKIREEDEQMMIELSNVADYFVPSYRAYTELAKGCESLTKVLTPAINSVEKTTKYRIDPEYNPEIDFKAGQVSRDCTRDKPLPFYQANCHNFKIYADEKYVGNIYIVESDKDFDVLHEQRRSLLIDSVQCPEFTKNIAYQVLKEFLPKLKELYSEQVDIVANTKAGTLSNYQPIREAMQEFIGKKATKKFMFPDFSLHKGFMNFQGGKPGEITDKIVLDV